MKNLSLIKLFLIVLLCLAGIILHAQKGKIAGKVFSTTNDAVISANFKLFDKDSLCVRNGITDSAGNFVFINVPAGLYSLQVKAMGYFTTTRHVYISNGIIPDTIFMEPSYGNLGAVVVTAKKPIVVIKPDTTEFNAAYFKTEKNATLEDIFKKIPGVEVARNGSIKTEGEAVTQIYVDGKPFFGTDLKAVTQNFPADIIDKIQIIDKRSDMALSTKVDDGTYERIINITLKKSSKKGLFGKDAIGYGERNLFEAKTDMNFFNNDKKLSIIAAADNTGIYDAGENSYYNNGYKSVENKQAKINYANKWGNNFDFCIWGGFRQNKNSIEQLINRQNLFFDSSSNYFEDSKNIALTKNIYSGLYFEYKPDSSSVLRFNESVAYNNSENNSSSQFNTTGLNQYKINEGYKENTSFSNTPSLNGQISYNRRLNTNGRNLFFNFSNAINNNSITLYKNFENYFYAADTSSFDLLSKQLQYNKTKNTNIGTTISYSEPLARNHTLNFSYTYNSDNNIMPEEVYDFNQQNNLFDVLNDSLSYHFINNTTSNAFAVNYNYNSKKIGFGAGLRWKQSLTESYSNEKNAIYQQTFRGFLPNLSFYSINKSRRLNIYYNSYIQAPQPYQIQPVVDNSNPLYLRIGNPALKYAVVHMLRYNFKYYNTKKERGFTSNASVSAITNNIGNSISYDNTTGKEISQAINTNVAYNWGARFSYFESLHIGNEKIKWNMNLSSGGSKFNILTNGEKNVSRNIFTRFFFGLTYDMHNWLNVHSDISISRQINKSSLFPTLANSSYFVSINPTVSVKPKKNMEINIDYESMQTTMSLAYSNTCTNMLNVDVTQYINTKKNIWVTLKAFNVLNQKANTYLQYGNDFLQSVKANTQARYLLLELNFSLNKIQ